ncbi:hypothetical protein GCM10028824_21910 [Hymenobacter segetis]
MALLSFCWTARAQTTPATPPKTQPVKPLPYPKGAAAPKGKAYGAPFIKDTAAFRRSGRPADAVPNRIRQK